LYPPERIAAAAGNCPVNVIASRGVIRTSDGEGESFTATIALGLVGISGGNGEGGNCGRTHGPQLPTVHAVIGSEVQGAAHYSQILGVGASRTGADIFDQNRTRGRAVALPQFLTVHAVIGSEVQGVAHRRQIAEVGARGTGADIFDQNRTCRRAVAFPQFITVHAVISPEEQGVARCR